MTCKKTLWLITRALGCEMMHAAQMAMPSTNWLVPLQRINNSLSPVD